MNINELSIKEKIGQRFIFGVNSSNVNIIISLIKNYYIGGVILYRKNYRNYDEMLSLIKKLKEANKDNKVPLFIAIDQEGGRVNRMPSEIENIKNIYDISKNNIDLIYDSAVITGQILSETGINMNFAPVLDLWNNSENKLLYKRCFYGNVDEVYEGSKRYINGLSKSEVISVIKHFPGHGAAKRDSHIFIPYIHNYKKLLENDILPFEYTIKDGIDALMVGHLVIRKLTKGIPASISYGFIDEYIRKKSGFDGLVITDEVNMLLRHVVNKDAYLKKIFLSGSDIILMKIKNNNISFIDKIYQMVQNNGKYMELLDESIIRILRVKEKYKINDDLSFDGCNVDKVNKKIIELNELCSKIKDR